MGYFHHRMILLDWTDTAIKPGALDAKVRELAWLAFEASRGPWEKRIKRPTDDRFEEFMEAWSGPRGGRNGNYQAAWFASGTKGGWHLYVAMTELAESMKKELVPMGVGVSLVTTYCESFYGEWDGVTVDYDSRWRSVCAT